MNFYSVIIGTELLNGRRVDKHFEFLNKELLKRNWEHKGSFVIDDTPSLIAQVFNLIKNDLNSVMFSFGGIGATPDDYTREVASQVFTNGEMELNYLAKEAILERFQDEAYPHRIKMANLPLDAKLLKNVVTNVPGFYLDNRFFFVPGFPSMAQSMVIEALDKLYPNGQKKFRFVVSAFCSENDLVDTMHTISETVELSSLPIIEKDYRRVVLSISSYDKLLASVEFDKIISFLEAQQIKYILEDSDKKRNFSNI
jgi:molybdopterin-biosynthesis enzyme MoeA-like protein